MTEIKFRAWDEEENKMYDVIAIHFHDNNLDVELQIKEAGKYKHKELSYQKEHIMQNAGLKDKNGKEIYEGDVVEFKYLGHHVSEIKKDIVGYYIENNEHGKEHVEKLRLDFPFKDLEIIGNIYESPELLERKK